MAKSPQRSLSKSFTELKKFANEAINEKQTRAVANKALEIIVKRTRLGYGAILSSTGPRFRFPQLSDDYVFFRGKKGKGGAFLSDTTKPKKANNTFTGQLLDSMAITSLAAGRATIGPTGDRDDPFSKGLTNEDVARSLNRMGRGFNNLTDKGQKQVFTFFKREFGNLRKRRFKRR